MFVSPFSLASLEKFTHSYPQTLGCGLAMNFFTSPTGHLLGPSHPLESKVARQDITGHVA